ncbi:MAG: glycosyltransferase family 4 protein, partial [bacterium]|nr:glycosyltransferase family 4 protein [bacterium]
MKIKVCHLTSVHPSRDTRILYKECQSLAAAGYDVTLIAKNEKKEENVEGVKINSFPHIKNRILRVLMSPLRMYRIAVKQKANIYHFHDPELLITGLLLRIFTRSKVIYDIHEDYAKNIIDRKRIKFAVIRH